MQKAMTVAVTLAAVLALGAVPTLAAGQDAVQPTTTATVQASQVDDGQAAKPADQAKPADPKAAAPAKPGEQAKPADPKAAAPAPAKPNPNALTKNAYGGGFRMTSESGRFSMRIMGAAQFRYTYMTFDDRVNGNTEDYSNFFLRRGRVWFDGHAYDSKFTYYFHLQVEPQSAVNLHDAWITYAFKPMFQLGLGRNKVAYGLEFLHSGFGLNMIDRSVMYGETDIQSGGGYSKFPGGGTETLALSGEDANTGFPVGGLSLFRSQGVQISGKTTGKKQVFEYQVGMWQGRNSKGASNPTTDHMFTGRVGFYPNGAINWLFEGDNANTQSFQTGFLFSAYTDKRVKKTNAAGVAVPMYKADDMGINAAFMARYRGFSADVEWSQETYDLNDNTVVGDKSFDRDGYRVQLGYFVKPKVVELVGRYSQLNRLKDPTVEAVKNSGLGFAKIQNGSAYTDAVEKSIKEITFGVNYYLSGAAQQHKVFVDYSRLTRSFAGFVSGSTIGASVEDQADNRLRAMLQIKF